MSTKKMRVNNFYLGTSIPLARKRSFSEVISLVTSLISLIVSLLNAYATINNRKPISVERSVNPVTLVNT